MSTSSLNGIPLTSVSSLLDAIQADPSKADTTWTASTTWSQQLLARNTIRTHSLTLDEPASLGGTDGGANPVEHVLGAFGSCLVVGYVLNASVRGITVNALRVEVQGKLDLQPFLGLAQGNAGFTSITADVHLDADASEEDLQALHEHVQRTSPVGNVLRRALPVSTKYVQRDDAPTPVDVQEHNGVPVEAVTGLVEAVKADVGKADTTWKAVSTWTGSGLTVQNVVRSHEYQLDEPKSLGGSNAGPNMVEVLLAAYGSCLTVGIVLAATTRGIDLQSLTIDTKGELDLHPFLGLAEGNAGFSSVTAGIDLRAASQDVTSQQLDELLEYVVATSPVGSILSRALDVQINLVASQ